MEGEEELRQNWEFAATSKLLGILSTPLSFSAPDPDEFEQALLNPAHHISLLANLHGRLLGLSAGASSAKKWLATTSRFIAKRPLDFDHIFGRERHHRSPKDDFPAIFVKEEPREEVEAQPADANLPQPISPSSPSAQFPREEIGYLRLGSLTRLLILHAIAELVLSEHDSLLSAGSIGDIPVDEMRYNSFATDAVGNKYWYFGDGRRLYREPGGKAFKTRLQQAGEDAAAAEKAAQDLAAQREKLEQEQRKKEATRLKEEARRKREEKKRKSMAKWAPRVAATRTTRASRRAEQSLLAATRNTNAQEESSAGAIESVPQLNDSDTKGLLGTNDTNDLTLQSALQTESGKYDGRTSYNPTRRRSRENGPTTVASGEGPQPSRTRKRPRKGNNFEDPTLRDCDGWQTICVNAESLKDILQRFQPDMVTILPSEQNLVRIMEEEIVPEFEDREEKIRKEQEKLVRKKRNEMLIITSKRSSRVQALEQKREEAARKAAEEEEKERELQNRMANFNELVKNQITDLERDLAIEIRNTRRAHGITDAINRDEQLHRGFARKAARVSRTEGAATRQSARAVRNSRRSSLLEADKKASRSRNLRRRSSRQRGLSEPASASSPQANSDVEMVGPDVDAGHWDGRKSKHIGLDDMTDGTSAGMEAHRALPSETVGEKSERGIQPVREGANGEDNTHSETSRDVLASGDVFTSGALEGSIDQLYTWMTNPDDGEPIRVLDKFFFALKSNFEDAPLELVDNNDLHVTGLGILVPPFGSGAEAIRIKIGKIDEWVIEYGADPKLWVKTARAWYELRAPAVEYQTAYVSTRRKYELCLRIAILGATYRTAELTYSSIVELLGMRYNEMQAFSESQVLEEKRFIISQMESVGTKALLQSGFIRELRKRIRQEGERLKRTPSSRRGLTTAKDGRKGETGPRSRRRSAVSRKQVIPRAVSTIVNNILRAATKSHITARKRKQTSDTSHGDGRDPDLSPKRMKRLSLGDECVHVPRVSEKEPAVNGLTKESNKHLIHVPKEMGNIGRETDSPSIKNEITCGQGLSQKVDTRQPPTEQASFQEPRSSPTNGKPLPIEISAVKLKGKEQSSSIQEKSSRQGSSCGKEGKKSDADYVAKAEVATAAETKPVRLPASEEIFLKHGSDDKMGHKALSSCAMTDIRNSHISNGHETPMTGGAYGVPDGTAAFEGSKTGN